MNIRLKADLYKRMQAFLEANADEIGSIHGIWQDSTDQWRNAALMADAAELVIDSMQLQRELEEENSQ